MAEHVRHAVSREADAAPCDWGTVTDDGAYPCTTHKGGTFRVGARHCSKSPDAWATAERQAYAAFEKAASDLRAGLKAFDGWHLLGHDGGQWLAAGPAGRKARLELKSPTPQGLLAKIQEATNPLHHGNTQGVLL